MRWFQQLFTKTSLKILIVIFIHNTCLDLFVVTSSGFKLYIEESLAVKTILTHLWVAVVVAISYSLLEKASQRLAINKYYLPCGFMIVLLSFGWWQFN